MSDCQLSVTAKWWQDEFFMQRACQAVRWDTAASAESFSSRSRRDAAAVAAERLSLCS